jgi:PmbA protein
MVVDPRAGGRILYGLLRPAFGSAVQQERSFWRGQLGSKLFSERLTITDDPLIPRGLASRPFDSEGISAKQMPIIEAGVLRNLYLDTYYARKLNMEPTSGDPSNRVVSLGSRSLDQIIPSLADGVYVTSWLGGNMDSTTGDFSMGVRGHLIDQGTIGAPVGEMNVTGNIAQVFASLVEVGNDPWPYSSVRSPTMVFEDVQFGGV